jgi:hypothetical protein
MAVGTASCCKAKNRHMWRHRLRRPACFKCPKCPKSISMPDVPNLAFGTWCSNVDVPKALSGFMQSAQLSRIQLWDVVTRWQNPESGFRDISMLSKVPKVTFGIPFGTSLHLGVTPILAMHQQLFVRVHGVDLSVRQVFSVAACGRVYFWFSSITGQGWNGTGSGSGQPRLESVHADLKNDRLQQQSGSSLSILTLEQRILSSRCRSSVLLPSAERLQPSTTLTTAQMAGRPVEYTVSFDECCPLHTINIHDSKP